MNRGGLFLAGGAQRLADSCGVRSESSRQNEGERTFSYSLQVSNTRDGERLHAPRAKMDFPASEVERAT